MAKHLHLSAQSGVVSSGNSLDFTKEDFDLFEQHGVAVKEMEAAAVAWAAHLHATPMFALKAITDIVDGERLPISLRPIPHDVVVRQAAAM